MLNNISPTLLYTRRLLLRELTPAIFNQLFLQKSKDEIMNYLHLRSDAEYEEMEERYSKGITTFFHSYKGFHLLDRETKAIVGRCDYHTWVPAHRRAEIGYTLLEDSYKNKGLMKEALASILTFGFEQMNLYSVEALVMKDNIPSLKLMKHFGFRQEGLLRNHPMVHGQL
ncbi:MAG: GNAT family N-acetyltransferase, partial [Pontibacter sp.]|nr:GNAT family N-acetyltransferase [Pontibacter sp.]